MKKVFVFAAVGFMAIGFSSCKKDWTCTCDFNGVESTSTINATKADAETACSALEITADYNCTLD